MSESFVVIRKVIYSEPFFSRDDEKLWEYIIEYANFDWYGGMGSLRNYGFLDYEDYQKIKEMFPDEKYKDGFELLEQEFKENCHEPLELTYF